MLVLSGEITLVRDNRAETFRAGDHCETAAGCQHTAQVGPEGVADGSPIPAVRLISAD